MAAEAIDSLTSLLPRKLSYQLVQDGRPSLISAVCVCAFAVALVSAAAVFVLAQKNRSLEPSYSFPADGSGRAATAIAFPAAYRRLFQQPTRATQPDGTSGRQGQKRITQDAPRLVDRNDRWRLVRVTRRRRSRTHFFASASVQAHTGTLQPAATSTASALPSNGTLAEAEVSGPQGNATLEVGKGHDNVSAEVGWPSLNDASPDVSASSDVSPELTSDGNDRAKNCSEAMAEVTQHSPSVTSIASEKPASPISVASELAPSAEGGRVPSLPTPRSQQ